MFKIKKSVEIKKNGHLCFDFGCGKSKKKGYVGVDCQDFECVDIVSDVNGFKNIPGSSACRIHSCHFIEHLGHDDVFFVLKQWMRILESRGILTIYFPDISLVIPETNIKIAINHVWGSRKDQYDYHKTFWTARSMMFMLQYVGYANVRTIPYFGKLHPYKGDMAWTSGVEGIKK